MFQKLQTLNYLWIEIYLIAQFPTDQACIRIYTLGFCKSLGSMQPDSIWIEAPKHVGYTSEGELHEFTHSCTWEWQLYAKIGLENLLEYLMTEEVGEATLERSSIVGVIC